jgi:hypothetical protein
MAQKNKLFTPEAQAELVRWRPLNADKVISIRGVVLFVRPEARDKFLKEAKRKQRVTAQSWRDDQKEFESKFGHQNHEDY